MRGENNRRTILMDLDAGTSGMLGVTGLEGGWLSLHRYTSASLILA